MDSLSLFGESIVNTILTKGYCVVELPMDAKVLAQVDYEIGILQEQEMFHPPAGEVVEGLLGEEGSTRVAELLDLGAKPAEESVLLGIDAHLDVIANAISPLAPEAFGFEMKSRTFGLLHESGTPRKAFPFVSQAGAMQWFNTFTSHRIMGLIFLGPDYGTLELQPFDMDSNLLEIETEPGMCVYLRADLLSHRFRSPEESYTLSCWFLQSQAASQLQTVRPCFPLPPVARALDEILNTPPDTALPGESVPRDVQRRLHHRQRTGGKTAVRGASVKLPSSTDFWSLYMTLSDGADCVTLIPYRRWDFDQYYDPGPASVELGKTQCRHTGAVEGIELFDNDKFRISTVEAWTLAPEQRQTLEVGYEVMYYSGFRKKDMEKTATGVYAGSTWNEWNLHRPMDSEDQGRFGATSNMNAILANRVSYLLGFHGASIALDTEGASSLVAVCTGNDAVSMAKERRTVDQSLCLGVGLLLHPKVLFDHAANGHLSRIGRCFSFGANADGHLLGDACGGVLLAPLSDVLKTQPYGDESHPVRGLICAGRTGNVGRASSLSAPSGPTDQRLLQRAMESAGISALDVDAVECHGTGSLLWDAVEVASLAKVLRGSGDLNPETLLLSAMKTCVTHSRAASGMSGLIKTLVAQSWGAPPPSLHLHVKNPHMDIDTHPIRFTSETSEFWTSSSYCGITAKGFGGAVAHVIAWGSMDAALRPGILERPKRPHPDRADIVFWPGGGGELEDDAHPDRAYTIVGSWSAWSKLEDMEEEEPGVYGFTVTLGVHGVEHFQICLDGDRQRLLHPPAPQAPPLARVLGPSTSATGLCWRIGGCYPEGPYAVHGDGCEDDGGIPRSGSWDAGAGGDRAGPGMNGFAGAEGLANGTDFHDGLLNGLPGATRNQHAESTAQISEDYDKPGDQYRVHLCVNGKWRTVIWEKRAKHAAEAAAEAESAPLVGSARHFVVASWNMWQLVQEMKPHPKIQGLYRSEVLLTRAGGEFQIAVNRDMDQVIFPADGGGTGSLAHPVCGPLPASATRGLNWFLDGRPGDRFRIEFQIAREGGAIRKAVSFRRVGHQELSEEQIAKATRIRYFIAGSWNRWVPQEMTPAAQGEYFQHKLALGQEGRESFQILVDNDWRMVLHPESLDSGPSVVTGPSDSDQCDGVNWLVGGGEDGDRAGSRYVIRLCITDDMPVHVEWSRRS